MACSHSRTPVPDAVEIARLNGGVTSASDAPEGQALDAELAAEYGGAVSSRTESRPLSPDEQLDRELAAEYGNPLPAGGTVGSTRNSKANTTHRRKTAH
jgi:hypothetical protein